MIPTVSDTFLDYENRKYPYEYKGLVSGKLIHEVTIPRLSILRTDIPFQECHFDPVNVEGRFHFCLFTSVSVLCVKGGFLRKPREGVG